MILNFPLQVAKFIEDNKLEFLESSNNASGDTKKMLTPAETQSKLLQLMNSLESLDCIKGWVQVCVFYLTRTNQMLGV